MGGPGDNTLLFQQYNRLLAEWNAHKDVKNFSRCNDLRNEIIWAGRQIGIPDTSLPVFTISPNKPIPEKPLDPNTYQGTPYKPDADLTPKEQRERDYKGGLYFDWFSATQGDRERIIMQWKESHPTYTDYIKTYEWLIHNMGEASKINNILFSYHYGNALPLDPTDASNTSDEIRYYYEERVPEAGGLLNWYSRTDLSAASWIDRTKYAFIIDAPQGLARILLGKLELFNYVNTHLPQIGIGLGTVVVFGGIIGLAVIVSRH